MFCPQCGTENPAEEKTCRKCTTILPLSVTAGATARASADERTGITPAAPTNDSSNDVTLSSTRTSGAASGWSVGTTAASTGVYRSPFVTFEAGNVIGNRYEVLQLLGEGGMGAVYKVRDNAVDRLIALKVIRPDLASRPEILARFKQELILARQVTHKNVIRLFDLGEADGVKFITMDFIEGRDLKSLLKEKGKLPPADAVKIIAQVCRALDAAHAEGVVHRDLKPQNIMLDVNGRVTVMDFGIARSAEMPGMTQTGALIGTPEYMSPEQARGQQVDARSDLFTLGIIFYELLTGKTPHQADTALATLLKRTQERARPPIELDSTIPQQISDVVMKCLEIDLDARYSHAEEILEDLGQDAHTGSRNRSAPLAAAVPASASSSTATEIAPAAGGLQRYWKLIAAGVAALLLISIGVVFRGKIFPGGGKGAPGAAISLAILPFHNASGDPSLDWLGPGLAEMLRSDLRQSPDFAMVSPNRLHDVLRDLRITPNSDIDPAMISRISQFTNAHTMVSGQFVKLGDRIQVEATLQDMSHQRSYSIKAEAPGQKDLTGIVDNLAQAIQKNLSETSGVFTAARPKSFEISSKNVDAVRNYSEGLELNRQGNYLDALKKLQSATEADPNFALAFSEMAQTYSKLGYDKDAEKNSAKAVDLSGSLPPQERFQIVASNAQLQNNYDKAIEAYENLLQLSPNDPQVNFNLAKLYEDKGTFDKAHDYYAKVLAIDPKYVDAQLATGRVEIKRGNAQGSLDSLNRALSLSIELNNQMGKATVLQALGVAYRLLNRPDDALQNYQQSLAIKRQIGDKRGVAASLSEIAFTEESQGKLDAAQKDYQEALKVQGEIGDKVGQGITLMGLGWLQHNLGHYDDALKTTKQSLQIQQETGNEDNQAQCLNNIGAIYSDKGQYDDALTYYQQALQLREKAKIPGPIAETQQNLAETSAKLGQYDQALGYYLRALELARNVGDSRLAAVISSNMGTLFAYQGRFGAALGSAQDALKAFQQLQDHSAWMAEIQGGYGAAQSQVGNSDEGRKNLDEAVKLARDLKADPVLTKLLDSQGDSYFYAGDFKAARPIYEQALQVAQRSSDRSRILISQLALARLAVREGRIAEVITSLKKLIQDADAARFKYASAESSVYLGEALLLSKNYPAARQELESAARKSENLGLKALLAKSDYLLGMTLRASGNQAEAARRFQDASKLLEEMHQESKSDALLKRADLKPIAENPAGPPAK
jgi:tetratricopeptide (TPR) repeat protein/predicted Ser/Thr protein kinase